MLKMAIFTADEAKTKWCPFARATIYVRGDAPDLEKPIDLVGHAANRILTDDPTLTASIQQAIDGCGATKCIGPACMAWRWHETHINGRDPDGAPTLVKSGETYGYCGLAGSPNGGTL